MSDEKDKQVFDIAAGADFDTRAYTLALELKKLLGPLVDEGTNIDAGTGNGFADLWPKLGGVEFHIAITLSRSQQEQEAPP
jgi:hypothetical protein